MTGKAFLCVTNVSPEPDRHETYTTTNRPGYTFLRGVQPVTRQTQKNRQKRNTMNNVPATCSYAVLRGNESNSVEIELQKQIPWLIIPVKCPPSWQKVLRTFTQDPNVLPSSCETWYLLNVSEQSSFALELSRFCLGYHLPKKLQITSLRFIRVTLQTEQLAMLSRGICGLNGLQVLKMASIETNRNAVKFLTRLSAASQSDPFKFMDLKQFRFGGFILQRVTVLLIERLLHHSVELEELDISFNRKKMCTKEMAVLLYNVFDYPSSRSNFYTVLNQGASALCLRKFA